MQSPLLQKVLATSNGEASWNAVDIFGYNFRSFAIAFAFFIGFLLLGYVVKVLLLRICDVTGLDEFSSGTAFERVADSLGTSTVGIIATTVSWFIYISGFILALESLGIYVLQNQVVIAFTNYIPRVIAAVFILIFGTIISDKAKIRTSDFVQDIKIKRVSLFPPLVKSSILFVTILMAVSQLGVITTSLYIVLAGYIFGVVIFCIIALRRVLPSIVSGFYIHVTQPYMIGDRIKVGEKEGIVQEIDMFTTRIEGDNYEHIISNSDVLDAGVQRKVRD
ncbi:MAG: mechanosensitive ion channel domain-containing protein [Halobacteria archaeon]